jgi:hypothetical protein
LNYLNQEWGLKLRPPPKARQAAGVVFDDATVQSLASLVLEVSATRALLQRRVRDSAEPETSGATEAQDSL